MKKKGKPGGKVTGRQLTGTVLRSTGSRYKVQTNTGELHECVIRGKFRLAELDSTNPVVAGDYVLFEPQGEEEVGIITQVLPRKNLILRKAISYTRRVHILCANVDQAILLYTLNDPYTSRGFADRFLVAAASYRVPVRLLFNKTDLLTTPEQLAELDETQKLYASLGFPVAAICARDEHVKPLLQDWMQGQVTFLGGHSGAGKSTLGNLIDPNLQLRTGEVSESTGKGAHTTTFAELLPLPFGGWLLDSPGIRELGVTAIEPEDLAGLFPEMESRMQDCRFRNCSHRHEPGCAIRNAVDTGEIVVSRYNSYVKLREELEADQKPGVPTAYQV